MNIESGCLAIIVKSSVAENIGKCVKVIKFIGKVDGFVGSDRWEIDKAIFGNYGSIVCHQRGDYLMRIDGAKELSSKQKKINFVT